VTTGEIFLHQLWLRAQWWLENY